MNGILLVDSEARQTVLRASKLNAWAVEGENSVQVRLGALPPRERTDDDPEAAFEITIRRALSGESDAGDQVLASFIWQAAAQPVPTGARTTVFQTRFVHTPPQAWTWTRGYAFTGLTGGDRQAIVDLLRRLADALAEQRIEEVIRLQSTQVGEQAIAVGESPETFVAGYRAFLQERMSGGGWSVSPIDPAALQITSMADGRIQHVTAGADPPVVARSEAGVFAIDPYLSKIDGVWTIVR